MPEVFAIVAPDGMHRAVNFNQTAAWLQFFSYPINDARPHGLPLEEAIRAYKAIGYRCVRCRLVPTPEEAPTER